MIRELLNAISAANGGPESPIPAGDMQALFAAISTFQLKHNLVSRPDVPYGFIGPQGLTLRRLRRMAGTAAPAAPSSKSLIRFPIPNDKRFHQNDSKWNAIKLNRARSNTYRIGAKGCALTSVATGFAAKGLKIANTDGMAEVLRSKLGTPYRGDLKGITPLTFEAWMTANNGQGYDKKKNLNISWKGVADVSSSITHKGTYYPFKGPHHRLSQIRNYLNHKKVVIAHISTYGGDGSHYVVLTGHNNGTTIYFWDVGYGYHTGRSNPFESNPGQRGASIKEAKSYPSAEYEVFDQFIVYD